jgi:hypothetical protein
MIALLLLLVLAIATSVLGWAWVIMLIQGAIVGAGEWHMGFGDAVPWGATAALVQGVLSRRRAFVVEEDNADDA